MFDQNLHVWLNGEVKPLSESGISPLTHSLHYGSGVFEGIRAYQDSAGKTHIFRLEEHIDRLFYSAEQVFFTIPFTKETLMEACKQTVITNSLKEAYLRPLVYHDGSALGVGVAGNSPQVLIAAWSWGQYLEGSVTVEVSEYRRISEQSVIPDAKVSGHYVNSLLATTKAKQNGYLEALLLDHAGNIAEGPGENIFFIKGTELHTPKLGKILKGITRDAVITFAADLGYTVVERDITLQELPEFESAFFTGTAAEVTPIERIDQAGKTLQTFDTTKATLFKDHFFTIIRGENPKYSNWLTYIK